MNVNRQWWPHYGHICFLAQKCYIFGKLHYINASLKKMTIVLLRQNVGPAAQIAFKKKVPVSIKKTHNIEAIGIMLIKKN